MGFSTLNFKDKNLVTVCLHFFVQNVTKNWRMYPGHEAIFCWTYQRIIELCHILSYK